MALMSLGKELWLNLNILAADLHYSFHHEFVRLNTICRNTSDNMINAVLVFNNAGQPRLTKFYTQLVRETLLWVHD